MSEESNGSKTRTMGEVYVEIGTEEIGHPTIWRRVGERHEDPRAAEKWIQEHGENGKTYRIIRHVKTVSIAVEQVRQAKLIEVD